MMFDSILDHNAKLQGDIDGLKQKLEEMKKTPPPTWSQKKETIPAQREVGLEPFWINESWLHNRRWNTPTLRGSCFWFGSGFNSQGAICYTPIECDVSHYADHDLRHEDQRSVEGEYESVYKLILRKNYTTLFNSEKRMVISVELVAQLLSPQIVSPGSEDEDVHAKMVRALGRQQKIYSDKYLVLEGFDIFGDSFEYAWAKYLALKRSKPLPSFREPEWLNLRLLLMVIGLVMLCYLLLVQLQTVAVYEDYRRCLNRGYRWRCLWAAICEDWLPLSRISRILYQL